MLRLELLQSKKVYNIIRFCSFENDFIFFFKFSALTGSLGAFIWDSSRLEYEAAQDCDLATATEQFARSGYGIGLPKGSFWTERVNKEVLAMHESGLMEELDHKWILQGDDGDDDNCPTRAERQKPATLGLSNMSGVFLLVGFGIVLGIGLIMIEVIYKKSQVKQQRQLDVARGAAERWKRLVEVKPKHTQTDPLTPRTIGKSFLPRDVTPHPVVHSSASRPQSSSSVKVTTAADVAVDYHGRVVESVTEVKGKDLPQPAIRSGKKHRKRGERREEEKKDCNEVEIV
jgi:ionotropic glutamate receptor NMDA 1